MPLLLRPKWLAWHAFALVATYAMLRLGLWQWHRAHATHSAQNMGYALQWPAFAVFGLVVWWRVCRDAVRPAGDSTAEPARKPRRPAPEPAATVAPVTEEEDPELAAYNRYLARLNEEAESAQRPGRPAAERGAGSAPRDRARPGRPAAERGAQ